MSITNFEHESKIMKTFQIVGIARNCEKTLVRTLELIKESLPTDACIQYFIVESDSTDNTIDILQTLKVDKSFTQFEYVSLGKLQPSIPSRVSRIAYCRNEYIKWSGGKKADYVIVADLDGVVSRNFRINLRELEAGYALFANVSGLYYDIFALRHAEWQPGCPLKEFNFLQSFRKTSWESFCSTKMVNLKFSQSLIEVQSAFGGLAIYPWLDFSCSRYEAVTSECEHVAFNSMIKCKKFIDPNMVIGNVLEHTIGPRAVQVTTWVPAKFGPPIRKWYQWFSK